VGAGLITFGLISDGPITLGLISDVAHR